MLKQFRILKVLNIIVLLAALSFLGPYGCGGGGSDDGGDSGDDGGGGTTITTAEAEEVGTGTVNGILNVVTRLLSEDVSEDVSKSMALSAAFKAAPLSKTISVTASSSTCDGGEISPVYGNLIITIYGSDIATGGSGSCRVDYSTQSRTEDVVEMAALIDWVEFNGAEATDYITLDGTLRLDVETTSFGSTGATAVATARTPSLTVGFIQDGNTKICEIITNITQSVTVYIDDLNARATSSVSGCISLCDEVFSVNGSETQTFTLP